ncbi:MAG: DUF1015 domain-containing protein [Planctomycetota bacterium]
MIHPFRGLRYDLAKTGGDQSKLVTQPYDKISPGLKAEYLAANPHNVVRLIRGESGPEDQSWHAAAGKTLRAWIAEDILRPDDQPAYYVYRQHFTLPDGRKVTRSGVTGIFDLRKKDAVRHHERTHSSARVDRRHLLDHTAAHFGQIFILRHQGPPFDNALLDLAQDAVDVTEPDGTRHEFSRLTDPAACASLQAIYDQSGFVIADGHHRFTVAGQYADDSSHEGANFAMVTCVDLEDPGLVVLPTHRILHGLTDDKKSELAAFIESQSTESISLDQGSEAFVQAVAQAGAGTIGVVTEKGALLWRPDKSAAKSELEKLDAYILDNDVIAPATKGLNEDQALTYRRSATAAVKDVKEKGADAAFLLNAVPPRDVTDIAEVGGIMPPKSTDFFPKMLTGFVIYDTKA